MKFLCVLCEGKTELLFCKEVLQLYFLNRGVIVLPRCLMTNRKQNKRGGITSYAQVITDLGLMIKQYGDTENGNHWFTTMFDLYALPCEFPKYNETTNRAPYDKVKIIEEAFANDVVAKYSLNERRFIPYIQLHEFEALVLCNIEYLKTNYPQAKENLDSLAQTITQRYDGNAELVDNGASTAPSKRIIKALEGEYHYNKPQSGKEATMKMGIDALRNKCPHFASWIGAIERELCV